MSKNQYKLFFFVLTESVKECSVLISETRQRSTFPVYSIQDDESDHIPLSYIQPFRGLFNSKTCPGFWFSENILVSQSAAPSILCSAENICSSQSSAVVQIQCDLRNPHHHNSIHQYLYYLQ